MGGINFISFLLFLFIVQSNFCQGIKIRVDTYNVGKETIAEISIKSNSFKKKKLLFAEDIVNEVVNNKNSIIHLKSIEKCGDTIVLKFYDPLNGKYSSLDEALDSLKIKTVIYPNNQKYRNWLYIFSDKNLIIINPFSKLTIKVHLPNNIDSENLKIIFIEIDDSTDNTPKIKENSFNFQVKKLSLKNNKPTLN